MKSFRNLLFAATLLLPFCTQLNADAGLANKENPVTEKATQSSAPTAGFTTIATIPTSAEQLVVLAENAQVKITHTANPGGITVATNCPKNWSVKGSMVRQVGFAKAQGGVAMMADALGSRAIVNGKIYILPNPMRGGLQMGPDGVKIGGQKAEPLAGTDMPGTCGDGPDAVEIFVPASYAGDLLLGASAASAANIDSWAHGKVECTLVGKSTLSAGNLKSLSKAVLDVRGDGKAVVGDLSAKVLVANVVGSGKIIVETGSADISNATVAGEGSITMKGKYANLKKSVQGGQGSIQISE